MHLVGVPGEDLAARPVLLLAEGYATAASTLEATGRPVAVALDAGDLVHMICRLSATEVGLPAAAPPG